MGACVFVSQYSGSRYTHLLTSKTTANLVAAKIAFLQFCNKNNISVQHFHANNGIFNAKSFCESVTTTRQAILYCSVNAHHQNGVAEKHI